MVLTSERLSLRRLTATEVRTILAGGRNPGPAWAPGYPLDSTLVAMAIQAGRDDQHAGVFGHFQVVLAERQLVIGDVGFPGPPDDLGEVTISYGIVPSLRGKGYASEAVRTLLDWALTRPEIRAVRADTELVNHAGQHVLLAAGMRHTLDDGDRRLFEIQAQ